jgi:hypothetical protein
MTVPSITSVGVKQAVPFFGVTNMEASLRFYVEGLRFKVKRWWIPDQPGDDPDRRMRWCWLELGDAAIMLQEFMPGRQPKEALGAGTSVSFMCDDALTLYRDFNHAEYSREIALLWETASGSSHSAIRMATALSSQARPTRQRKVNWKNRRQHVITAAAINMVRIASWANGMPIAKTSCSHFAALQIQAV